METLKKYLGAILAALAGLAYLFIKYERGEKQEAQAELLNADTKREAAVLDAKAEAVKEDAAELKSKLSALSAEKPKVENLSTSEVEDYWNKKK